MYHENQYPDLSEEGLLAQKVAGDHISPPAENYLMILSCTDLEHLCMLYTNGVTVPEILHIAKCKSNGQQNAYREMKQLLGLANVYGTMDKSEQSSF